MAKKRAVVVDAEPAAEVDEKPFPEATPPEKRSTEELLAETRNDLVLIANTLGRLFSEPVKSEMSYILLNHQAMQVGRKSS